jgi:hypothetical protein
MTMGATIRIDLNKAGVRELLNCPAVCADRRAQRIAAAAGEGMEAKPATPRRNRARAAVVTESWDAKRAEATDRALTRAIDAGRG